MEYYGKTACNTIIKGVGVYILSIILARLIGRKLIFQMTFFDFVIVANAIVGQQFTSMSVTTAVIVLAILTILIGYLHIKSFTARKLINLEPVTLVQNGTILEENMKTIRLTINLWVF
ncbi:YetF domain-containing protein [Clostridium magnum]|uniref:Uncharacterized protein n=1 Tax=Clostridium magnum DSM 2767 TaxID=1121326 RepID=A0A168DTH4_9CLOT|nr:YetF domain-containing protein [Clostridium magnum]KZL91454.1 hypothetical protein CLMAG_32130 [Clostridium magnum DSM 2767]SHH42905.1 hypothetical protein SAMN02745944_00653 [Clostridium magnum DSM 2767]